jgi:hypothetical protein
MKKFFVLSLVTFATILLGSPKTFAAAGEGIYLGLHLNYQTSKTETNGSGGESKTTTADLLLGMQQASGLYLGGIYTTVGDDFTITGSTTNQRSTGLGVSVGYVPNEFMFIGHYFLTGTYDNAAGPWDRGTGLGLDVGYLFPISGSFHLGGAMVYRSIEYKGANNATSGQTLKVTSLSPRLLFSFLF